VGPRGLRMLSRQRKGTRLIGLHIIQKMARLKAKMKTIMKNMAKAKARSTRQDIECNKDTKVIKVTGKGMMKNPLYRKDKRENEKNNTNKNITMGWNAEDIEAYEDKN
jgi:hypothetical protein